MIIHLIREIAEQKGFTVGDLARIAHIRASLLLAYWNNPKKVIDTYLLDKLSKALHVPAQELIRSEEPPE